MSVKHKSTAKFKLLCTILTILTFGTPITASHCEIVEHSEIVKVQNRAFFARMNKCVLKPSYTVKSNIVYEPTEPDFYQEGRICCCVVDGHTHTFNPDKEIRLKFKKVTKCSCVPCQ